MALDRHRPPQRGAGSKVDGEQPATGAEDHPPVGHQDGSTIGYLHGPDLVCRAAQVGVRGVAVQRGVLPVSDRPVDSGMGHRDGGAGGGRRDRKPPVRTVALDEYGPLTRYHPDGTTSPLE